jgi:hypothetical protein
MLGIGGGDEPPAPPEPAADVWYKPSAAESRSPGELSYAPFGVLVEPQLAIHNLRGGTLTSVLATLPLSPYVGLFAGGVFADTARFAGGVDFFRYVGVELPIARGSASVSAIAAPTVAIGTIFTGGILAGDASIAPLGVRAVVDSAHLFAELRLSGHLLVGGEPGLADSAKSVGTAETLGLQLVVAPLFVKVHGGEERR